MATVAENTFTSTTSTKFSPLTRLNWCADIPLAKSRERVVLLALCRRADSKTGRCRPHIRTIGEDCGGLSESTVKRALNGLVEQGCILKIMQTSKRGDPKANVYQLLISDPASPSPAPKKTPPPVTSEPRGGFSREPTISEQDHSEQDQGPPPPTPSSTRHELPEPKSAEWVGLSERLKRQVKENFAALVERRRRTDNPIANPTAFWQTFAVTKRNIDEAKRIIATQEPPQPSKCGKCQRKIGSGVVHQAFGKVCHPCYRGMKYPEESA